jgi:hypothetical protein
MPTQYTYMDGTAAFAKLSSTRGRHLLAAMFSRRQQTILAAHRSLHSAECWTARFLLANLTEQKLYIRCSVALVASIAIFIPSRMITSRLVTMDRKFYFGFLLLEQIAALSASISDLLEDPDVAKISTFEEYVSYKTSWLQFAAEAGYDCESPDFKTPTVRVVETFPNSEASASC